MEEAYDFDYFWDWTLELDKEIDLEERLNSLYEDKLKKKTARHFENFGTFTEVLAVFFRLITN